MRQELLTLLAPRKGHFRLESGHHGNLWLDLGSLFLYPSHFQRFAIELANGLSRYNIFFRLDPAKSQINRRFGFWGFNALYAVILIPSALWMPLTFLAVEQSSVLLLWMVRIVLVVVGLASLSLLFALLKVEPRRPLWAYWLAVLGAVFFCIQTAVLDALLWVAFFRV